MEGALLDAWGKKWYAFVLVSHSFELLKGRKQIDRPLLPDRIVNRRFERLCRFLGNNRDKFCTRGFADLDPDSIPQRESVRPLRGRLHQTAARLVEQVARRVG
jgi:hypothetical protein